MTAPLTTAERSGAVAIDLAHSLHGASVARTATILGKRRVFAGKRAGLVSLAGGCTGGVGRGAGTNWYSGARA